MRRGKDGVSNKVSEQHTGTLFYMRGGVTGAPVTELEYKLHAVLEEADMATYRRIWGGTTRNSNLVPKTCVLGVGFFYGFMRKRMG